LLVAGGKSAKAQKRKAQARKNPARGRVRVVGGWVSSSAALAFGGQASQLFGQQDQTGASD